jgi:hypothetical protein
MYAALRPVLAAENGGEGFLTKGGELLPHALEMVMAELRWASQSTSALAVWLHV